MSQCWPRPTVLPSSPVTDRPYSPAQQRLTREVDSADHGRGQIAERSHPANGVPESGMREPRQVREGQHRSPRLLEGEVGEATQVSTTRIRKRKGQVTRARIWTVVRTEGMRR